MISLNIQEFAEQILKDRVFMGNFQEKRYVDKLNAYRDVIVLDKQEKHLCDDLIKVKRQLNAINGNYWASFTEPHDIHAPATYCLWTNLDDNQPNDSNIAATVFGDYWFQIKTIHFTNNSMEIKLKILRSIDTIASTTNVSAFSMAQQAIADIDTTKIQQYVQENIIEVDWLMLFYQWRISINQAAYRFFSTEINWKNICYCIQLIGKCMLTCFHMCVYFVQFLGEFTLKLVFELTKLFRAITPISLAVINLITKIIGGFYILLAMIWKDSVGGGGTGNNQSQQNALVLKRDYGFRNRAPINYREYSRPANTAQSSSHQQK